MAEGKGNKKRLSINLSIFTLNDQNNNNKLSPKKFEDPNGTVVGLGIVAAMNNNNNNPMKSKYSTRAAILAISPRSTTSNPIPIFTNNNSNCSNSYSAKKKRSKSKRPSSIEEMEMCEEYTCVISHVGSNLIKKREYFDGEFIGNINSTAAELVVSSVNQGGGMVKFIAADFLNSCFLCKKQLQGLDIFMYRGEKAFCSAECRCTQISIDEHKEKCGSGAMKSLNEYSASPCSGPMQFFTGVAVA